MTNVRDRVNQFQQKKSEPSGASLPTKQPPKLNIPHPQPLPTPPAKASIEEQSIDYRKTKQAWEDSSRRINDQPLKDNPFQKLPHSGNIRPPKISDVQMPEEQKSRPAVLATTSVEKRSIPATESGKRSSSSQETGKRHLGDEPFDPSRHWTRQSSRFDEDISIENMFLESQEQQMSNAFQLMYKVLEPMHLGTPIDLPDGISHEISKDVEARAKKLINRIFGPKPGEEEVISRCLPAPAIKMIAKLLKAPIPQPIAQLTANDLVTVKRRPRDSRQNQKS